MYKPHHRTRTYYQLGQQLDQLEENRGKRMAAQSIGLQCDAGITAVSVEMLERCHEAVTMSDWAEDMLDLYPDDYSDWVEETRSLRNGG